LENASFSLSDNNLSTYSLGSTYDSHEEDSENSNVSESTSGGHEDDSENDVFESTYDAIAIDMDNDNVTDECLQEDSEGVESSHCDSQNTQLLGRILEMSNVSGNDSGS
jgi:hypothetical protein